MQTRMGWPACAPSLGRKATVPARRPFRAPEAQTAATERADWPDRPSQRLHGEQAGVAGKDRAARPASSQPRRICTQASQLHLQPPDDRRSASAPQAKGTADPGALEPRGPACRVRTARPIAREGVCRNSGGIATSVAPASTTTILPIHLRRLTTSLSCRGCAPNLAGAYSFNRKRAASSGVGCIPDRELDGWLERGQSA